MAFISKFKTDTAYSNVDINEALSLITGQGVLPSSPNEILSSVTNSGVTISDKRCEVVWADDDKTAVKICSGAVVMSDGSYIIISDEILSVPSDALSYVFILNDIVRQNIPVCSSSLPSGNQSFVLLATIENGKITDKRRLATSKVADFGTHPVLEISASAPASNETINAGDPFLSIDVGEGYSRLILTEPSVSYIAIVNLETGIFEKIMWRYSQRYDENYEGIDFNFGDVTVSYTNGLVSLHCSKAYASQFFSQYTFNFTVF